MNKKQQTSSRPSLNKKQTQWLNQFLEKYPQARQEEIHEGLSGDRVVVLEWWEFLKVPLLEAVTHQGIAWQVHQLKVKLKRSGVPRYTGEYQTKIIYPYCPLETSISFIPDRQQLVIPLSECFAVKPPINPVVVRSSRRQRQRKQPRFLIEQFLLPL